MAQGGLPSCRCVHSDNGLPTLELIILFAVILFAGSQPKNMPFSAEDVHAAAFFSGRGPETQL